MNSQQLLYINIILGVLFLIYFLFGRKGQKAPTQLNLKNKDTPIPLEKPQTPALESKVTILEPAEASATQKNLAIFFIFNGHDWEAYSVLGVAQGANLTAVTAAYQKLLSTSDPQSFEFLEAAYQAILKKKRNTT